MRLPAFKTQMPRIHCKDGASLSVQARDSAYCTPRTNKGPYTAVEVGFVKNADIPDSWKEYSDYWKEDEEDEQAWKKSDIYAWIPVELVEEFIALHGGIDIGKTLDYFKE